MQKNATILIPDISGYTELFSKTTLDFSTSVLCELLNELMRVADEKFRVAEIEGDAILFYIKNRKLPIEELINYCLRAYKHFHQYLNKVVSRVEDPEARSAAEQLTVKFIAHWGPIAEMNIANFSKPVGLSVIQAHNLLKNSIDSRSYILITEAYANGQSIHACKLKDDVCLQWHKGSEEYPVIGKIHYHYALLKEITAAKKVLHTI